MTSRRDEAIILRTKDYGESDRLITFFSSQQGRLTGIAKGARRSKKRFVNTLEPLSQVTITYRERSASGLVRIEACELSNPFAALRLELSRWGYASVGCEMVLEMAPEHEGNPSLFHLLRQFLGSLEAGRDPESTALLFQTRALDLSGYAPNLQGCARCGQKPPAFEQWYFSIPEGRLLCPDHRQGSEIYPLSLGSVLLLRQAQCLPLGRLWRLRFHPRSRKECRVLLLNLTRHYIEKDLKSLQIIRQVGHSHRAPGLKR